MLDGALSPGLGKELQEPDKQTIVVPLQDGTKWSDGSELTADDVAFTFGLAKSEQRGCGTPRCGSTSTRSRPPTPGR